MGREKWHNIRISIFWSAFSYFPGGRWGDRGISSCAKDSEGHTYLPPHIFAEHPDENFIQMKNWYFEGISSQCNLWWPVCSLLATYSFCLIHPFINLAQIVWIVNEPQWSLHIYQNKKTSILVHQVKIQQLTLEIFPSGWIRMNFWNWACNIKDHWELNPINVQDKCLSRTQYLAI